MKEKLETLKERILRGTTNDKDIDIINEVEAHIEKLESQLAVLPEPAFLETREEMYPANIIIENATIYVNEK